MSNEHTNEQGHILVVDDNRMNRIKLWRVLEQQGHTVGLAENGQQALDQLRAEPFDLVLLDIVMPEMDGFQVLEHLKDDPDLRAIPVIVISAVDEMESVVRCIEMGAEDYLPKPFDPVLLRARIGASLEKKRLRDQEQAYLRQLQQEQEKSERLLLNILPQPIAERLKQERGTIADSFAEVTVLFADLVGFTALSSHMPATDLVILLNDIFSTFDCLAEQHGLEKIKTIGDAYLLVGGLPTPRPDHAAAVADMALAMRREIDRFCGTEGHPLQIRIGMHSGPVVAGVIGTSKFSYDLWGDTVNIASRMESHGIAGSIQMTSATCRLLDERYTYEERGTIAVKGRGELTTYLLTGKHAAAPLSEQPAASI
jgi:class 3 adenylate cyclase